MTADPLIELAPPDLRPWRTGNTGIPYVWSFEGPVQGPSAVIMALVHGNEYAGALALIRMLEGGLRPNSGKLTFVFANVSAFERFDPAEPRKARFLDEDMNRVWDEDLGLAEGSSIERRRAQELLPILTAADYVLDLHSMHAGSQPLMLSGWDMKGRKLAARMGMPSFVVADRGHVDGPRLIDWASQDPARPVAILLEAGQHWARGTARTAFDVAIRFLEVVGNVDAECSSAFKTRSGESLPQSFVEVTDAVAPRGPLFKFCRAFNDLEVIETKGTPIAQEGDRKICTPYDDCVLIMPSLYPRAGITAVRLGRFVPPPTL